MTSVRRFTVDDLYSYNNVNFDVLTETYNVSFYSEYLARWPDFFSAQTDPSGRIMAYYIGKAEGEGKEWHGHVSAVTVAPEYRRLGLARRLMYELERISKDVYDGFFVDLFVRVSNALAVGMYEKFGYSVYRKVIGYYSGEEDAYDMRKPLPRDKDGSSAIPLGRDVMPHELWQGR